MAVNTTIRKGVPTIVKEKNTLYVSLVGDLVVVITGVDHTNSRVTLSVIARPPTSDFDMGAVICRTFAEFNILYERLNGTVVLENKS